MQICIVSCVFPPEPVVTARTSAHIAQELALQGHEVRVVTNFPNRPGGKLYKGFRRGLYQKSMMENGLHVLRCFSVFSQESHLFSRFLENMTFGLSSGLAVLFMKRPDVIYANTWPIFAASILAIVARLCQIPLVISVQDLYPESLQVQGRLTAWRPLFSFLRALDTWVARSSRAVITISERFARVYRQDRKIKADKIVVVPNWGDEANFTIFDRDNEIRRRYSIPVCELLLTYGGNIGMAAGVETVIQAVAMLPEDAMVRLLIAGEGSNLRYCQDLAYQKAAGRVIFQTPWSTEETLLVLGTADILVLPTKGKQSIASAPSKLVSYLFAAKPIIVLADEEADAAHLIRQTGCGWVIEPDRPKKLADLILRIKALSFEELERKGKAGREYALEHYSRSKNVQRVLDTLYNI